jgi:HSP20 family protein
MTDRQRDVNDAGRSSESGKQSDRDRFGEQAPRRATQTPLAGDQQRAIQTGRDQPRSTGTGRRQSLFGSAQLTPSAIMRRLADDMDRLIEDLGIGRRGFGSRSALGGDQGSWTPQLETFRRGDKLVIRADLPGLTKEDVKVEVDDGMLAICGERREEREEDRDDFYRSERTYGQFYRSIALPEGVNESQVDASFKNGVLEVTLPAPKERDRTAKRVEVK